METTLCSSVGLCGGVPTLFVNGKPFPAAAYMTYFVDRGDFAAFAKAGYRLFSLPVLCAGRWINAAVKSPPFTRGIFDGTDEGDFSVLDASVEKVLRACPDALLLPRLNLSAPLRWVASHPESENVPLGRELLYSPAYGELAREMLRRVLRHVRESPYAGHIVGWMLAGGNTEEWFHFDLNGGLGENALPFFNADLKERAPGLCPARAPDLSLLRGKGPTHGNALLERYLEFANRSVAELIVSLARTAKEETGRCLAVGAFYGYSTEVTSPLWGTHALKTLLNSPDVDFICSPNSYCGARSPALDWPEMFPAASVRLHGKLCLQECDVRTFLTRPLCETVPGFDPERVYVSGVWSGPGTREGSLSLLKKTFCRQLIARNGFWWFDMWGGWYRDPALLAAVKEFRELYEASLALPERQSVASLAVFTDESVYALLTDGPLRAAPALQREDLGALGAPYDLYDLSDFDTVYEDYRAVLFLLDGALPQVRAAAEKCEVRGIPVLSYTKDKTRYSAAELRAFCKRAGVHVYLSTGDLLYANASLLAVYAVKAGEKRIDLGGVYAYCEKLTENGLRGEGRTLTLFMRENETRLFSLRRIKDKRVKL